MKTPYPLLFLSGSPTPEDHALGLRGNKELPVQRAIREALERVRECGVCETLNDDEIEEGSFYRSVCGFPMQAEAPSIEVGEAAALILEELARGSGGEDEESGLPYDETLETIMIFFDACSWLDVHAIAIMERTYAHAGLPEHVRAFLPVDYTGGIPEVRLASCACFRTASGGLPKDPERFRIEM